MSEKYKFKGYRIDGVAACRLAYQYFEKAREFGMPPLLARLPQKQDFIGRKVSEPYAVQLAGEFDIWDKRNPDADTFQMGLRSGELSAHHWDNLLSQGLEERPDGARVTHSEAMVEALLKDGRLLQSYQRRSDEAQMRNSFVVEFEGFKFLALNTPAKGSLGFASKDVPETGHDALLKFNWSGQQWDVSMYHAKHRTDIDLSVIAVKYGGGGHKGACGFRAKTLPFVNSAA